VYSAEPAVTSSAPKRRSSAASNVTATALLVAGVGFVVQMAAGITNTPTIPPGLVVIIGAALIVTVVPTGWAPVAGPEAGLFNLLALVVVGAADRLVEPTPASAFIGAWMMVLGLIVATIAGTIGAARNHRASTAISLPGRADVPAGPPRHSAGGAGDDTRRAEHVGPR
jgi:hypothetical protein